MIECKPWARGLPSKTHRAISIWHSAGLSLFGRWRFYVAQRASGDADAKLAHRGGANVFKIDAVCFPTTRGHFTHYRGQVILDFDRPVKSFTTFTVESGSVDVGSPAFNDFVKSGALLDAERFPTMSFTSTQAEKLDAHTARVIGNLTMLGVSKPITLTVNVETEPSAKGGSVAF